MQLDIRYSWLKHQIFSDSNQDQIWRVERNLWATSGSWIWKVENNLWLGLCLWYNIKDDSLWLRFIIHNSFYDSELKIFSQIIMFLDKYIKLNCSANNVVKCQKNCSNKYYHFLFWLQFSICTKLLYNLISLIAWLKEVNFMIF